MSHDIVCARVFFHVVPTGCCCLQVGTASMAVVEMEKRRKSIGGDVAINRENRSLAEPLMDSHAAFSYELREGLIGRF